MKDGGIPAPFVILSSGLTTPSPAGVRGLAEPPNQKNASALSACFCVEKG